jgi:hypothetical protein
MERSIKDAFEHCQPRKSMVEQGDWSAAHLGWDTLVGRRRGVINR